MCKRGPANAGLHKVDQLTIVLVRVYLLVRYASKSVLNYFQYSFSGKRGEIEMPIFEDDDIDDSDDWDDEEFHSDTCSVKI